MSATDEDVTLSHKEIIAGLTDVASRVMAVVLANGQKIIAADGKDLHPFIENDVIEVLKLRREPPFHIQRLANWSPLLTEASQRDRDIFVALILSIYN